MSPLSLSSPLLFSLSHSQGTKGQGRGREGSLSPGPGGLTGKNGLEGVHETRREVGEGRGGADNEVEKGDVSSRICVIMFCAPFPLYAFFWGGCLAGEARLFSLSPCHVKDTRALWDLVIPWYSERARAHFLRPPKHTLLREGGEWGERSSTSVMGQEVLEQSALHTATTSNMWTRLMRSCCGSDIDSFSSQRGIHGPTRATLIWHSTMYILSEILKVLEKIFFLLAPCRFNGPEFKIWHEI